MNDNDKNKTTNKILTITVVILIIIIIFLLLKGCSKNNENILHNGKVNVFEIKCDVDCNCQCENCDNKNTEREKNNNSKDNTKEVNKEVDDNATTEVDIKVFDEEKTWKDTEVINIFEDSTYVVNGKIAPESNGTYQFVIKNSTPYDVKYNIEFDETNDYSINIKYRLKRNKEYVINDWVTYSQLKQENISLNSKINDTYDLEWKWFSSTNDNSIGENIDSKYGLSINIRAVQEND